MDYTVRVKGTISSRLPPPRSALCNTRHFHCFVKMPSVFTTTRIDYGHHTDSTGRSKLVSIHFDLASTNIAARNHCRCVIRNAFESSSEIEIEGMTPDPVAALGETFDGEVIMAPFETVYDSRDKIEAKVEEMEVRNEDDDFGAFSSESEEEEGDED